MIRTIAVWLVLLGGVTPLHGQSVPSGGQNAASPVLRSGDAVRVSVWQRPDLSGEFVIGSDGRIVHPILRDVVVADLPFTEAVGQLGRLLQSFHGDAHFVAEPLIRIGIGGEVRQPNLYHIPADMTPAYAIALAGGPTDRGRLDRVELVRAGRSVILDITDPAHDMANQPLESGDQLRVARRTNIFREYVAPMSSVIGAIATIIRITR